MIFSHLGHVRERIKRLSDRFRKRAVLLLYHRIADIQGDPQLLAVRTARFACHMAYIDRHYPVLSLETLAHALVDGTELPEECVVVTFDDGYADNLFSAKPILARHGVPATVFITAGYLEQRCEFWWDELERIFLLPSTLPGKCRLPVGDHEIEYDLTDSARYTDGDARRHQNWNVTIAGDPTSRHRVYRDLCTRLRSMRPMARDATMTALRAWSGRAPSPRDTHRPLTVGESRELISGGVVTVGAHTRSHPSLAHLPVPEQVCEIRESREQLSAFVGGPVTAFAYPYGSRADYSRTTRDLVRQAGFSLACANYPSVATRADDVFALPRFVVRDWSEETFAGALQSWFGGRRALAG